MSSLKEKTLWCCTECGFSQHKWSGQCSECKHWNTLHEEKMPTHPNTITNANNIPIKIEDIKQENICKIPTGLKEFDKILGEGLVEGSFILLGGDPGIGKSTLLLQISLYLAQSQSHVLYVCGEESVSQTLLRAQRIHPSPSNLLLLSETNFSQIKIHINSLQPEVVVIDSIQIIYNPLITSSPGSVSQVRECAAELMQMAKQSNIVIFIIGHVTKSGEIAGPRILEHLVDTVLYFEGDKHLNFRIIRSVKNRFGSTNELALFEMSSQGLKEIKNPSEIFLKSRNKEASGSIIIPTAEGSRTILIELQALVTDSPYSNPMRRTTGIDSSRFALLIAVLEKKGKLKLFNKDIFVSIIGGLKVVEPALDLGIALAIASSLLGKKNNPEYTVMGEVGLGGEIRSITNLEQRIKESMLMGFSGAIIPYSQLEPLSKKITNEFHIIGVKNIGDALRINL